MSEVRLLKPEEAGLMDKIQIFEDGIRTEAKSGSYEFSHHRAFTRPQPLCIGEKSQALS